MASRSDAPRGYSPTVAFVWFGGTLLVVAVTVYWLLLQVNGVAG